MNSEVKGVLFATAGMFLYGIEPVVINANPSNPIAFAALSTSLAALILWFIGGRGILEDVRTKPGFLKYGLLMGLFGTALAYLSYSFGAMMSSAINAALITRSEVLWSFLLSWVFLRERIGKLHVLYGALLIVGLLLVMTQGKPVAPRIGDVLLLLVPLFWQMAHVLAKKTPYRPVTIVALRNTFGALLILPFAFATGIQISIQAPLEGMIISMGQILWYSSIRLINLSKATLIITPAPAVAIVMGILMGQPFTAYHAVGFLLITIATVGASRLKSEVKSGDTPL